MHALLRQQLTQFFGDAARVPTELHALLGAVDGAYLRFDEDRHMLERSLELSSTEPDRFFRLDPDGTIVDEKGASAVGAWLAERTIGRRIQDLLPPAAAAQFVRAIGEVRGAGARLRFEHTRGPDESAVFEARLLPLHGTQFIAMVRDITAQARAERERERAQEALRGRTDHLLRKQTTLHELGLLNADSFDQAIAHIAAGAARMMNVARVGLWLFDANGSALVRQHLHVDGNPVVGAGMRLAAADYPRYFSSLSEGRFVAVADAQRDSRTSEFANAYLEPFGITSMLHVPIRREGRMIGIICYEHIGPIRAWSLEDQDAATSVVDFISIAFETDRRRHLEDQLRQSQKMEAIGLLAGGVAHDFNNLLGVIRGYAEIVAEGLPDENEARDDCQKIITAAKCAADLTRKLLAFSKRQILQVELYDLNDIVGEFSSMLNRIVGEDIEVRVTQHAEPLTVKADAGQIEQVLLNLCSNSRQAMRDGGRLTIDTGHLDLTPAQALQRAHAAAGSYAVLRVADTGPGMNEATLARVFEPFFTTKAQGTGLGLATVYGIVQQHSGFIDVDSAPDRGTTFSIHLPLQTPQAKPLGADPAAHKPRGGTETILIAEDEGMLRDLMAESLGQLGYRIMTVADGEEAVREFERHPNEIDLAILDTVMPRVSGADAYVRMRAVKPHLKAIFISGYAADGARLAELLETERLLFIQKPFSPKAVALKVREVLEAPATRA
jgi:signal transduction histidine kinase